MIDNILSTIGLCLAIIFFIFTLAGLLDDYYNRSGSAAGRITKEFDNL